MNLYNILVLSRVECSLFSKDRAPNTTSFFITLLMSLHFIICLSTSNRFSVFYEIVYTCWKYCLDTFAFSGACFVVGHAFFGCDFLALYSDIFLLLSETSILLATSILIMFSSQFWSIVVLQFSILSNDYLFETSYTSITPLHPLKYVVVYTWYRSYPAVSNTYSFMFLSSIINIFDSELTPSDDMLLS